MSEVFLSYNNLDRDRVRIMADALRREGFQTWWDQAIGTGETYDEVTEKALRSARVVVVLWSPRSVASRWVRSEAAVAHRAGRLLPVMIEPCERPVMFELVQSMDLSHWQGRLDDPAWRRFCAELRDRLGHSAAPEDGTAARPLQAPSIAILPFSDLSGEQRDYFADGMVEEISTVLARYSALFVVDADTGLSYRGTDKPPAAIARELGVRYLLSGSVRRMADRVRVSVRLIDAETGHQLWADKLDDHVDDLFDLQERIAWEVASRIDSTVERVEMQQAGARPTESLDAYQLCMRGFLLMNQYRRETNSEAAVLADRAMAIDPDYAMAAALAAFARATLFMNGWAEEPAATRSHALELAARAQVLARENEYALSLTAAALLNAGGDVGLARQLADRAITINPGQAYSLFWGGWAALETGEPALALTRFEHALRISPKSLHRHFILLGLGESLFLLGRFEEAAETLAEPLRCLPHHPQAHALRAASLFRAGRTADARALLPGLEAVGGVRTALFYFRHGPHLRMMRAALEELVGSARVHAEAS